MKRKYKSRGKSIKREAAILTYEETPWVGSISDLKEYVDIDIL